MRPSSQRAAWQFGGRALCAGAALACAAAPAAEAQGPQPLPGIIVTLPPAQPPQSAPPAPTPAPAPVPQAAPVPRPAPAPQAAPAPPAAQSKTKAAPKAAAKPAAKPAAKSAALGGGIGTQAGLKESVNVFVNDDPVPITAYEIDQRARLMAMQSDVGERAKEAFQRMVQSENTTNQIRSILEDTIRANAGKSREQVIAIFEERKKEFALNLQKQAIESARSSALSGLKKTALDELIDERLKLQEAKRLNLTVNDADVDRTIKNLAQRNNLTEAQFAQHLKGQGADLEYMKSRFRAMMVWDEVVRVRFRSSVSVSQRDIDNYATSSGESAEDSVELQLRRITLALPGKIDQKVTAQRLDEAERLRRQFKDCNSLAELAAKAQDAKFENIGLQKAATLSEPVRGMALAASAGQMLPPNMAKGGIELYAVCGRNVVKGDEQKRSKAQQELMNKEFDRRAKALLRDLRNDAQIEYR